MQEIESSRARTPLASATNAVGLSSSTSLPSTNKPDNIYFAKPIEITTDGVETPKTNDNERITKPSLNGSTAVNNQSNYELDDFENSSSKPNVASLEPPNVIDKMSLSEVLTDSSGDWSESHDKSEALLSDLVRDVQSSFDKVVIRGNDETDGRGANDSPFRVTEIPVTISVDSFPAYKQFAEIDTETMNGSIELSLNTVETDSEGHTDEEETVTEDDKVEQEKKTTAEPSFTRDKTMKIFKQLKKAKQRSKKCLAPPAKITKSLPDISSESKERSDSFEKSDKIPSSPAADVENVEHLKEDIMAKSGIHA